MTFSHLDQDQLSTLRMLRNGQLLGSLIRTYKMQTNQQLLDMHSALDAADTATIAAVAHSLKSASFSLGATRMGQLSTALESAAMQCDIEQCTGLIMALQESYGSLLPELDREGQS